MREKLDEVFSERKVSEKQSEYIFENDLGRLTNNSSQMNNTFKSPQEYSNIQMNRSIQSMSNDRLKQQKLLMNMVIHDLRSPTTSIYEGLK